MSKLWGYTLVERDGSSYLEGPANLTMILNDGGIVPFEIAFNRIALVLKIVGSDTGSRPKPIEPPIQPVTPVF